MSQLGTVLGLDKKGLLKFNHVDGREKLAYAVNSMSGSKKSFDELDLMMDNLHNYHSEDMVKEYNELVNTFETSLAELATRELSNVEYLGYKNDYGYVLKHSVLQEIKDKHYEILKDKMNDVDNMANEVHALLSLSDDKDYQIEVLINYGILDKKTKQLTI